MEIEMHKEYIASEENYQEYIDRVDNNMLINSKIKLAKMYEEKVEKLSQENQQLHEEKEFYNQSIKDMINDAIQFRFHEDISEWLESLNINQLLIVQKNIYTIENTEYLKKLVQQKQK